MQCAAPVSYLQALLCLQVGHWSFRTTRAKCWTVQPNGALDVAAGTEDVLVGHGKQNGDLAPYGRRMKVGQWKVVPKEAAVLRRVRDLLVEKWSWRGVAMALNREGKRTRR